MLKMCCANKYIFFTNCYTIEKFKDQQEVIAYFTGLKDYESFKAVYSTLGFSYNDVEYRDKK